MLVEAMGWVGAAGILGGYFLLASSEARAGHTVNICSCSTLTFYNWLVGVWPGVFLNFALTMIAVYGLKRTVTGDAKKTPRWKRGVNNANTG